MAKKVQLQPGGAVLPALYGTLLQEIKTRIREAQVKATLSANREMVALYWNVGKLILHRQEMEGWGASVIPKLAFDLHNDIPEIKGFSERNIGRMIAFYREYPDQDPILPQAVAKLAHPRKTDTKVPQAVAQSGHPLPHSILPQLVAKIPWGHNILLMEKVKDLSTRTWYMQKTIEHGWSRNVLWHMIDGRVHERQGKAVTNFKQVLPPAQSDLALQVLKDPYIFDFLTIEKPFHERELETGLLTHLEKFLVELGAGFAFVGRQVRMEVGSEEFFLDLLFYHLRLRSFVVVELKTGDFKAEYAGKMNFYCNMVDDRLRHKTDEPTIGLILCQNKNRVVAEYALKGMNKAIGVSQYALTRALPKELRSSLPSIAEIERELGTKGKRDGSPAKQANPPSSQKLRRGSKKKQKGKGKK